MKLLEIVPSLSSGGAERFVVDLSNELVLTGHDVTLLILDTSNNGDFHMNEVDSSVKIIILGKKMRFDYTLLWRINTIVQEIKPDVVHTHLRAITYSFLSCLLNPKIQFYHTIHSAADKEACSGIDKWVRKYGFKSRKILPVTISEESRQSFLDFYRMDVSMIQNGRNVPEHIVVSDKIAKEIDSFKKSPHSKVLIQLARMDAVKRHKLMANVVNRLYLEGYDFILLMIGRKNEQVENEIYSLKCPIIHMLGERHNVLEYLAVADAYCLCSSHEGMPISLIEALGCGAAPVCTPVGGIVNTVEDGINGFLSNGLDEEDYYIALKRFLELSDKQLAEMKQKVHESYKPYSMTTCCKKYIELFEKKLH